MHNTHIHKYAQVMVLAWLARRQYDSCMNWMRENEGTCTGFEEYVNEVQKLALEVL